MLRLRLKHIDLFNGKVFQDPREVNTKAANYIDTVFVPVDPAYLECFTAWVNYLRKEKFFADTDALFPKAQMGLAETGGFQKNGLSRDPFATTTPLNKIIRNAIAKEQMPQYTPHAFRTTLIKMANDRCTTVEAGMSPQSQPSSFMHFWDQPSFGGRSGCCGFAVGGFSHWTSGKSQSDVLSGDFLVLMRVFAAVFYATH